MGILSKKLSLAVAIAAIIGLGACGTVRAQGTESLPGDSGMLCKEPNAFAYIKKKDDSLDFAYRLYLEDSTCSFAGNARPNSSGWTYRDESCTFYIKVKDDAVSFSTGDDDCRDYCGFKAHIYGRSIPLNALVKSSVTPAFLGNGFDFYECP